MMSLEEIVNRLLVYDSDSETWGLRTVTTSANCNNLSNAGCGEPPKSIEDIMRHVLVEDECGELAINLIIGANS